MAERLPVIRLQPQAVVDWWAGWGGGADLLRQAYPQAKHLQVEPTEAWLQTGLQRYRAPWWRPRRGAVPDVVSVDRVGPASVQMVWANMMLHAVKDPPSLMAHWHRLLQANGVVMFSCLGPDTVRELSALYGRMGWPAPTIDFVDMHDLGDMLVHAGFADPVMDQERITLSWDGPQALIAELRQLGANASPARFAGLRTPGWRRSLESALMGLAGGDGRLGLTFEISYGHAFKGLHRAEPTGEVRVSLEEMRAMTRQR